MDSSVLQVNVYTDGGSRGNPGPAAAGAVVLLAADGSTLWEGGVLLGKATNNVAEYHALLTGLKAAADLAAAQVDLFSDSELLVRQMSGRYRVKNEGLRPLFEQARQLAGSFDRCDVHHVRREKNTRADGLVNRALDAGRNVGDAAE